MTHQFLFLFVVVTIATITDVWKGFIYNWLTLPAILIGLCYSAVEHGYSGLGISLLGLLIGGGILFIPFCFGVMGGGDVKLMAAVGALSSPYFVIETVLVAIIAGGITGFFLMIIRGKLMPTLLWSAGCLKAFVAAVLSRGAAFALPKSPQVGTAPFALSILIGVIAAYNFDVLFYINFWM